MLLTMLIGFYMPREGSFTVAGLTMAVWLLTIGLLYGIYQRILKKLAFKQNMMSWMVNQIPGGFLSTDVQGRIVFINEGGRQIIQSVQQSDKEIMGMDLRAAFGCCSGDEDCPLWNSLKYGQIFHKVRVPVGDRTILLDSTPIVDPITHQIVGLTAYFQDISEEERLDRRLRKLTSEAVEYAKDLQTLLNFLPISVISVDQHGRIVHFNEMSMTYIPQLKRDDIIGQSLKNFMEQIGVNYEKTVLSKALNGIRTVGSYSLYDGKSFLSYAYPIEKNGEILGAVGIYQEITEMEQLKDDLSQMERLSLVGQMAASITHEIRNPMAVIKGFIQLIKERTGPELQEYFVLILEELNRANEIINDFLSLAQNRNVPMESVELNAIVRSLHPIIQADANMRGAQVELLLQPDLSPMLLNEKEIKQLILNLVRNGLEAMNGSGVIKIETKHANDHVELLISDTGTGISEEKLARIFEPFYTSKEKGTGLGLPVCLSIVQKHGGQMIAKSALGKGTTFVITLPVKTE
ncbi:ATP-binding protein [Paenibacillus sedimenti]|uniref:ATP-binding protein n=1 Tax=Paenibacillus sedimenti TaxID=2770274 RepID=UPI00165FEE1C|nr:ATP-binding protein [Paenibacillus sedimenti]